MGTRLSPPRPPELEILPSVANRWWPCVIVRQNAEATRMRALGMDSSAAENESSAGMRLINGGIKGINNNETD